MNEKLTIQDLVELLVNRHEVSQEMLMFSSGSFSY